MDCNLSEEEATESTGLLKEPKQPGLVTKPRTTFFDKIVRWRKVRPVKSKQRKAIEREIGKGMRDLGRSFRKNAREIWDGDLD